MKLLLFRTVTTDYLLFTNSYYDWNYLKKQYPEITEAQWIFDRTIEVDPTNLPCDRLISYPNDKIEFVLESREPVLVSEELTEDSSREDLIKAMQVTDEEVEIATMNEPKAVLTINKNEIKEKLKKK